MLWGGGGGDSSLINIQAFLTLSKTYFLTNLVRNGVLLLGKSCFHSDFYQKKGENTQKKLKTAGKEELKLAGGFMARWVHKVGMFSFLILSSFPGISLLSWDTMFLEPSAVPLCLGPQCV